MTTTPDDLLTGYWQTVDRIASDKITELVEAVSALAAVALNFAPTTENTEAAATANAALVTLKAFDELAEYPEGLITHLGDHIEALNNATPGQIREQTRRDLTNTIAALTAALPPIHPTP